MRGCSPSWWLMEWRYLILLTLHVPQSWAVGSLQFKRAEGLKDMLKRSEGLHGRFMQRSHGCRDYTDHIQVCWRWSVLWSWCSYKNQFPQPTLTSPLVHWPKKCFFLSCFHFPWVFFFACLISSVPHCILDYVIKNIFCVKCIICKCENLSRQIARIGCIFRISLTCSHHALLIGWSTLFYLVLWPGFIILLTSMWFVCQFPFFLSRAAPARWPRVCR